MAKLFSCFGQRKKTKNSCDTTNKTARRSRRPSNETNQVVYVVNTGAENPLRYSGNLTSVYRTETIPQTPQYEKNFQADGNRHSKSYPVSPERRSLYKVYSYEQRPSFEKQRLSKVSRRDSRDSRNIKVYAANVSPVPLQYNKSTNISIDSFPFEVPIDNVPRRSTLSHGVDYEKELQISKESPKCVAEKPAEDMEPGTSKDKPVSSPVTARDDTRNMQEIEKQGTFLRTNAIDKSNFSPQSSSIRSQNIMYLVTENVAEPKIKSVVRASKDFALGRSVKTMIYRAEDLNRPMSANKYVHQMPIKANKHNTLTTSDGKILKPLTSDNVRRLSTSSGKNKQIRLSLVKPVEDVEGFPLAHGGEVIVAAPMIGGGGGVRKGGKPQKPKPILRKGGAGRGAGPAMRGPPPMDDYDDFPYEGDYGRGGYSYYDDVSDMFAPVDDRYSAYGGGYYDDGYGYGYPEEDMGRYGRGPAFRGARPRQQVYAAQMPDITLPGSSVDKGKNPPFKKIGKQADKLESCIDTEYYNLKSEKEEKEHKVKMISSAQQTDLPNELDFICFSPDKCFKTSEAPDDPNSKLRWRIIIKRGDEE